MKLDTVWETYKYHTQTLSSNVRQLAFAGIALVWVFRVQVGDSIALDRRWILPTVLIVLGLALDLLHYAVGSLIWGGYGGIKECEEGVADDTDFDAPRWINWPAIFFFWAKTVVIIVAYVLLLNNLASILFSDL